MQRRNPSRRTLLMVSVALACVLAQSSFAADQLEGAAPPASLLSPSSGANSQAVEPPYTPGSPPPTRDKTNAPPQAAKAAETTPVTVSGPPVSLPSAAPAPLVPAASPPPATPLAGISSAPVPLTSAPPSARPPVAAAPVVSQPVPPAVSPATQPQMVQGQPALAAPGPAVPGPASPYMSVEAFLQSVPAADRERLRSYAREVFELNLQNERVNKLRQLCADQFGPPEICNQARGNTARQDKSGDPRQGNPESGASNPASFGPPTAVEISGLGSNLSAILQYPGGPRVPVTGRQGTSPGTTLPTGEEVIAVRPGEILVRNRAGHTFALPNLTGGSPR